jgi:hypothetical protein
MEESHIAIYFLLVLGQLASGCKSSCGYASIGG